MIYTPNSNIQAYKDLCRTAEQYMSREKDFENAEADLIPFNSNIRKIKKYVTSLTYPSMKDREITEAIPYFEAVYLKMLYYRDLWASTDWIYATINDEGQKLPTFEFDVTLDSVNLFVRALLSLDTIKTYKQDIAKIIRGTMSRKSLMQLYHTVRLKTDTFSLTRIDEGFYNPFDDEFMTGNDVTKQEANPNLTDDKEKDDDRIIRKIRVWQAKNKPTGYYYTDGKVISTECYYIGDTIEEAPVRLLHDCDMYSPNVRDIVFNIDGEKRVFGIPYGIAALARTDMNTNYQGNVDYEYDKDGTGMLRIFATKKIRPGQELILQVDVDDSYKKNRPYHSQSHPGDIMGMKAV